QAIADQASVLNKVRQRLSHDLARRGIEVLDVSLGVRGVSAAAAAFSIDVEHRGRVGEAAVEIGVQVHLDLVLTNAGRVSEAAGGAGDVWAKRIVREEVAALLNGARVSVLVLRPEELREKLQSALASRFEERGLVVDGNVYVKFVHSLPPGAPAESRIV